MGLITHHFLFKTEVKTPLELDEHSGSALRGNLYESVWRRFCTNKASPSCADCPLHTTCPVSALVAPLREEHPRGRDRPRPYILIPPIDGARHYAPGESLTFGLTLFGDIVTLLPYIILSLPTLESVGLGRKQQESHYQRGTFTVREIEVYHPLSGQRQTLYQSGKAQVAASTLAVTPQEVQEQAATLPTDSLTLNFLTPTRIVDQEHLVSRPAFRPLIHRLFERLDALNTEYGAGDITGMFPPLQDLLTLADHIHCVKDATHWKDVGSYSRRTRQRTPVGGILGQATFEGDLAPFREILLWGELVHVGKSAVKGNGWYTISRHISKIANPMYARHELATRE